MPRKKKGKATRSMPRKGKKISEKATESPRERRRGSSVINYNYSSPL